MLRNQRKIGVILSYGAQFVQILTGLIYTPVMLRLLGQSEYGLYQLVYSVVSYLSLLSLGFGSSYMRFYAMAKSKKDEEGISKLNGMFMLIFMVMSIICILCGIVIIRSIRSIFGSGLSDSEYKIAEILMELMIINLALTFPNSVFNCIIISQERFLFQKSLIFFQYLLNPFLTLPLLIMGYRSVGMVLVTTLLTFGVLCLNTFYCVRRLHCKFVFKGLQFSLLKDMWTFTFFIFINQVIDQINWNVDKFLLGRLAGTSAVAIYGIGGQINNLYLQFSTSVSNVFVPRVNKIVAEKNDNKELTFLFTKVGRVQFVIMMLILSGFFFFGKPFIRFWVGEGYTEAYYIALLLTIPVTVPLIQNLGVEIQRAKNKHKDRSIVYLFIAIMNIFISVPLIKVYGPKGASLGTMISLVLGNVLYMNWYYHNRLEINVWYFWKNIAMFIPGLIAPFTIGTINLVFIDYDSLVKLGIGIVLYTVVYCGSMYLFGMNTEEKELIQGPFNKIKKKK